MRALPLGLLMVAGFAAAVLRPTPADRFAEMQAACAADPTGEACEQVARWLADGDVARLDPEEPGLYFAMACEAGRAGACARAAPWAQPYGDYEVFELDVGCMIKRSAFACEEVATALHDEHDEVTEGGPRTRAIARSRMKRALDLYLVACTAGRADACMGASRGYASAFGVEWDLRQAAAYEAKACELGLPAACEQAADRSAGAAAIALYRRACDGPASRPHACLKLARAEQAARLPGSVVAASYRRACGMLAFDACAVVSRDLDQLDRESPAIATAFARWCEAGEPRACELVKAGHPR
jgi:TPR repeat protein